MTQSKEGSKPSSINKQTRTLASGGLINTFPGRLQPSPNEDISHFSSVDYETGQMPQTALDIDSQGQGHRNGAKSRNRDHPTAVPPTMDVSFDGKAVATQLPPRSEESYKAEPFTATLPRDHDLNGTDQYNTNTLNH